MVRGRNWNPRFCERPCALWSVGSAILEAVPAAITEVMYKPKAFKLLKAAVHTGSVTAENSANVMRALAIVNDEYEAQQGPPVLLPRSIRRRRLRLVPHHRRND